MPWMRDMDNHSKGDSGAMSMALWVSKGGDKVEHEHNARPRVGVAMRVGSITARTFSEQDWWQTTLIEEILEDTKDYVKFRTVSGSTYEWRE